MVVGSGLCVVIALMMAMSVDPTYITSVGCLVEAHAHMEGSLDVSCSSLQFAPPMPSRVPPTSQPVRFGE